MEWSNMASQTYAGIFPMLISLWSVWVLLIIIVLMKITVEVWIPKYIKNKRTEKKINQVNSWSLESDLSVKKKNEDSSHKETDICPKCGGMLREVNGKFGKFLGCSNYPKCRFIKKIIS